MRWPADYHMHTPLCRHAVGSPSDYASRAVALGLTEIGFTDHSPMAQDDFDDWRMRADQLETYVADVEQARKDHPGLRILLGLEVDFIPGHEAWISDLAERHPWDYLIGSVHYISESWAIDNPQKLSQWKGRDPMEIWTAYFERLEMAANSGLFDIIGHADLPKKFGIRPSADCTPLYTKFLNAVAEAGIAIELNTAGLRKDCREIYPCLGLLELAWQRQIPITFGSDAHAPGEVGMNFTEALALARAAGYTETVAFARRHRLSLPLPTGA